MKITVTAVRRINPYYNNVEEGFKVTLEHEGQVATEIAVDEALYGDMNAVVKEQIANDSRYDNNAWVEFSHYNEEKDEYVYENEDDFYKAEWIKPVKKALWHCEDELGIE